MQDDNSVAHRLHLGQDVGGEQHRPGLGKVADQLPDLDNLRRVQPDRRLVQNQNFRVADQRLRQTNPLLISFGEVADHPLGHVGDPYQLHDAL